MWEVQNNDYKGCKFTLTSSAYVSSISLYCKERWSNPQFSLQLAIYDASGGSPNTLVAQTNRVDYTDGAALGWRTQYFSSPVLLPAGDYVLTWHFSGSTSFLVTYDVGGATTYYGSSWTGSFPVSFGTPVASANLKCSIYATYSPVTAVDPAQAHQLMR